MNRQKTIEPVEKLSGRELDAAVAESVMVHVVHVDNGEGFCENCGEEMLEWKQMRYRRQGGIEPVETRCVPEYSESIEAAMQVVERMREQGWSFACTLYAGQFPYASFCKGTVATSRHAEADSLPVAICLAALAAVESLGSD
jgi:hypothetical protein